ncbi:MAG: vWA domain-containing protein [Vulcanimicrobiaceae bacterium]
MADLATGVLAFCAVLRAEYGFAIGHAEGRDALRAVEIAGVADLSRFRSALRLVCCGKHEQIEIFDRAFTAFFLERVLARRRRATPCGEDEGTDGFTGEPRERHATEAAPAMEARHVLAARYSPDAGSALPPAIPQAGLVEALADASRLIASLHLGRSRRWKPQINGSRFDMRRTLRTSLHTGGDPAVIRMLGHPLRNPKIVMLIDASRSMAEDRAPMLQFAYALTMRSRRTSVFLFSTALRDVTRDLRRLSGERQLQSLGEAWGGGTRIGASLLEYVRAHGMRLNRDTMVIIASDGLDVGEIAPLERAMREIHRRSAGVVWLNPHAGTPGYVPAALGMQAAMRSVDVLLDARNLKTIHTAVRAMR